MDIEKQIKNKKTIKIILSISIIFIILIIPMLILNRNSNKHSSATVTTFENITPIRKKYISKKTNQVIPLDTTVYLTKTGEAFHLDLDYGYIKGKDNLTESTIEDSKNKYSPCLRCFK